MTDEVTYFAVDNYRSVTESSGWDTTGRARAVAFEFFNSQPADVIAAFGITFDEDLFLETTLNIPVEKANTVAEARGLPYRFIIEFWTFEEEAVDAFLAANDISYWGIIRELLRTRHGMNDNAINQFSIANWDHFTNENHKKLPDYVLKHATKVDEFGGHLIVIKDTSTAQKEAKDLIISVTENFIDKIKKKQKK
jgi:hypothetical protein